MPDDSALRCQIQILLRGEIRTCVLETVTGEDGFLDVVLEWRHLKDGTDCRSPYLFARLPLADFSPAPLDDPDCELVCTTIIDLDAATVSDWEPPSLRAFLPAPDGA